MSIMNIFRQAVGMQPNNPTPATGGNSPVNNTTVPTTATPQSDGKTVPAIPAAGTGDNSPLANYAKLWDTKDTSPKSFVPDINIDPAAIQKSAAGIDFTKVVPTELLTKALAGDSTALMQIINGSAQAALAQSITASAEITKQALTAQAKKFNEEFAPELLRRGSISDNLRENNPLYSNPAIAPVLTNIEKQLASTYPNASAQEVSKMAKEMFSGMALEIVKADGNSVVTPADAAKTPGARKAAKEEDWGNFFGATS